MKTHILALIFALSANAAANIMIKAGMRGKTIVAGGGPLDLVRTVATNPLVVGGVVLFALNVLSYAYVLTRIPLSVAYPIMTSGGFLIVVTASTLLLRETVTLPQIGGFVLIIAGVALVASQLK